MSKAACDCGRAGAAAVAGPGVSVQVDAVQNNGAKMLTQLEDAMSKVDDLTAQFKQLQYDLKKPSPATPAVAPSLSAPGSSEIGVNVGHEHLSGESPNDGLRSTSPASLRFWQTARPSWSANH